MKCTKCEGTGRYTTNTIATPYAALIVDPPYSARVHARAPTLNADDNAARIDEATTRSVRAEIEGRKPEPAPTLDERSCLTCAYRDLDDDAGPCRTCLDAGGPGSERSRWLSPASAPAFAPTLALDSVTSIRAECDTVCRMLLAKNAAYGDSALAPVRIFSRADEREGLRVRIDDKLSRVARGTAAGEDVTLDLIGYLILLRIAERRAGGRYVSAQGYFAIGIDHPKHEVNVGTLWRTA